MAKHIIIKVPGKHPQTGELTTFELKGQRMDIDIGGQTVPFLIHGRGIGTSLTHIPSGYRIALLGGWLTARYAIPENKPSRTACAQMAIDRLVAQYGSLHLLDRLNCKPVINETADSARWRHSISLNHRQHKGPALTGWPLTPLESPNMTSLITGLEVHRYAPELNKLHLRNRQSLPAPGITTIKEAKAHRFGRWQSGYQVTITVSHPDYINLSRLYRGRLANLTDLPEHLTRLRQRHNVPGTIIDIELRYC